MGVAAPFIVAAPTVDFERLPKEVVIYSVLLMTLFILTRKGKTVDSGGFGEYAGSRNSRSWVVCM